MSSFRYNPSETLISLRPMSSKMCNPCPRTTVTHLSGLYTGVWGKPPEKHLERGRVKSRIPSRLLNNGVCRGGEAPVPVLSLTKGRESESLP